MNPAILAALLSRRRAPTDDAMALRGMRGSSYTPPVNDDATDRWGNTIRGRDGRTFPSLDELMSMKYLYGVADRSPSRPPLREGDPQMDQFWMTEGPPALRLFPDYRRSPYEQWKKEPKR